MPYSYLLQENGDYILQENGGYIIIDFSPTSTAFRHTLRLLYGNDKRRPRRTVDLAQSDPDGHIFLRVDGLIPGPAEQRTQYRESFYLDGSERWFNKLDNIKLSIEYDLRGDTSTDLQQVQAAVNRFVLDAGLFRERRQGEKCWLEHCFADGLADMPEPILGQQRRFFEIVKALPRYPKALHGGALVSGNIEGVILELECKPWVEGLEDLAPSATGLADSDSDVDMVRSFTTEFVNESHTITGWILHRQADYVIWEYYQSAGEYIKLWYDYSEDDLILAVTSGGVTTSTAAAMPSAALAPIQVTFTNQKFGNATIYVNGAASGVSRAYVPFGLNGQFKMGGSVADTGQVSYTNELDAWKIWTQAMTAAQALQHYNNESPIKSRGEYIGRPLYHKTRLGNGGYDAVDGVLSSAAKDHWGVIGNLAGDLPAKVRWFITLPATSPSRVYWLGVQPVDDAFTPNGVLWLDYSGTADGGASSGDAYESSGSGTSTFTLDAALTTNQTGAARGHFQVLGRMKVTTNAVVIQPYYQLGSSTQITGDSVSVAADLGFVFDDFGDIFIDWPGDSQPPSLKVGLIATRASTAIVDLDFIQLLPSPSFRVEAEAASLTTATGDTLVIDGRQAWVMDASDSDNQLQRFDFEGDEVFVYPGKYNYVFLLPGEESVVYPVTALATVKAYVTPRWLMGGGPVA